MTIQEIGRMHLGIHSNKEKNIFAVREGNKLLRYLKDTKRYKNCIIKNYEYIGNDTVQFGAISIEYEPNKVYISFEGTDQLFSGWKENFMLSYQFPTESHKLAIAYLNKHYTFSTKKIIVGGHSKGGNLALAASMYANFLVKGKITNIYNIDGPGLLEKEFNSKSYQKIKPKYIHIIPDYSIVGLLLHHENDIVVHSTNKTILAHSITFWEVEGKRFKRTKLSPISKELDDEIKKWFEKYNDQDKIDFINNLDLILKKANINSIIQLKEESKYIMNLIIESKEMTHNTKKVLMEFIGIIIKCIKDTKTEEFKQFLSNIFKVNN